nr:MAG TPA: Protein of unknown function (DUF4024) [Caudoviricetes sp.]
MERLNFLVSLSFIQKNQIWRLADLQLVRRAQIWTFIDFQRVTS